MFKMCPNASRCIKVCSNVYKCFFFFFPTPFPELSAVTPRKATGGGARAVGASKYSVTRLDICKPPTEGEGSRTISVPGSYKFPHKLGRPRVPKNSLVDRPSK